MASRSTIVLLLSLVSASLPELVLGGTAKGQPWPWPQKIQTSGAAFLMPSNQFQFSFVIVNQNCDILTAAVQRYSSIIYQGIDNIQDPSLFGLPVLDGLRVDLRYPCESYPHLDMDESYTLVVNDSMSSVLSSYSIWGILRGLETFSQLVYDPANVDTPMLMINSTNITDSPRFRHRGLLVDSSRHFLKPDVIKMQLDALAYNKMNVLHWHMTDDQSFSYESVKFPSLSQKGAWFPRYHSYSPSDVADIIEYARFRGIRVIPEFDTPSHTQSWGKAYPMLLTQCYKNSHPAGRGPMDPSLETTYSFLTAFFEEVYAVFKDQYVHLGMDEVSFSCWQSNPNITAFMKKMNISGNYGALENYYVKRVLQIINGYNKNYQYVIWQEPFDNGVTPAPNTVIHVWKGNKVSDFGPELSKITAKGYHALLSSCWYLDRDLFNSEWSQFYECDPQNFNGTDAQKALVVGGETCMWGEEVDGTNITPRVWPRASAVAERLWSSKTMVNPAAAAARLDEQRCRMIRRGLQTEPATGPGFCPREYDPVH